MYKTVNAILRFTAVVLCWMMLFPAFSGSDFAKAESDVPYANYSYTIDMEYLSN